MVRIFRKPACYTLGNIDVFLVGYSGLGTVHQDERTMDW